MATGTTGHVMLLDFKIKDFGDFLHSDLISKLPILLLSFHVFDNTISDLVDSVGSVSFYLFCNLYWLLLMGLC